MWLFLLYSKQKAYLQIVIQKITSKMGTGLKSGEKPMVWVVHKPEDRYEWPGNEMLSLTKVPPLHRAGRSSCSAPRTVCNIVQETVEEVKDRLYALRHYNLKDEN